MRKQEFIVGPGAQSADLATAYIQQCAGQRRKMRVTVCQFRKDRSDEQNNALFGVAYKALSDFTGYDPQELHELFLKSYFGTVVLEGFGASIEKPRRSTTRNERGEESKLNTLEFAEFYEFIQRKGSEIGCSVPDPDPRMRSR